MSATNAKRNVAAVLDSLDKKRFQYYAENHYGLSANLVNQVKAELLKTVRVTMLLDTACQVCNSGPCNPDTHLFLSWNEAPPGDDNDQDEGENTSRRNTSPPPQADLNALNTTPANTDGFVPDTETRFLGHMDPNVELQNVM